MQFDLFDRPKLQGGLCGTCVCRNAPENGEVGYCDDAGENRRLYQEPVDNCWFWFEQLRAALYGGKK